MASLFIDQEKVKIIMLGTDLSKIFIFSLKLGKVLFRPIRLIVVRPLLHLLCHTVGCANSFFVCAPLVDINGGQKNVAHPG